MRLKTPEWRWEVEGTQSGDHDLRVTLSALISVDGQQSERAIKTFEAEVDVNIPVRTRIKSFVTGNWQWIVVIIVLPIVGYLIRWWSRRRKKSPPSQVRLAQRGGLTLTEAEKRTQATTRAIDR